MENCWASSVARSPDNGSKCVNVVSVKLIEYLYLL